MQSTKCPHCGLVNFASAEICKRCNVRLSEIEKQTPFQQNYTGNVNALQSTPSRIAAESLWENSGFRRIIYGLLWIGGGSLLTYYTHNIFYGAIIFGVVEIFRGTVGLFTDFD